MFLQIDQRKSRRHIYFYIIEINFIELVPIYVEILENKHGCVQDVIKIVIIGNCMIVVYIPKYNTQFFLNEFLYKI